VGILRSSAELAFIGISVVYLKVAEVVNNVNI
jgi:hypothetical protein